MSAAAHSSQAGLSTLRAGIPVRIDSAVSKGMVPTEAESERMYRIADESISDACGTPERFADRLMSGVLRVLDSGAGERAQLAALHRLAGAWEAGAR